MNAPLRKTVDVHVPQAGDQTLARRIHHLRVLRDAGSPGGANLGDATTCNHHGHLRLGRRAGGVNDCDVGEGERLE